MQPTTQAFLTEVTRSHTVAVTVELWSKGQKLRTLYPIDGSVTVDARRAVRRNCDFTIVDEDGTLNPYLKTSPLTPYGNEVKVFRGVTYQDGTTELVPLGVFTVSTVSVSQDEDGVKLSVSCEDRSKNVQLSRWSSNYVIAAGTNYATVIENIIQSRFAGNAYSVATTTYKSPTNGTKVLGTTEDGDPWSDLIRIAEAIGDEAYFAADGTLKTTPIPSLTSSLSSLTFAEGANGVTLSLSGDVSSDNVLNGVIAKGEGSHLTTALESRVWDTDDASPTRSTGPLGERPTEWSSSLITSQTQLDDVAAALLDTVRGQTVNLSVVPNPALDVRDIVRVTSTTLGIDSLAMVDTITIPLTAEGTMEITARTRGY